MSDVGSHVHDATETTTAAQSQFGVELLATVTHHSWGILLGGISFICLIAAVALIVSRSKRREYTTV
jgi:hypothetical protein